MGSEVHVNFFTHPRCAALPERRIIAHSLHYAVDIYHHPQTHTEEPYSVGADAYARWISAVKNGHGAEHGNWWNATVWAECRTHAAAYFTEIAALLPETAAIAVGLSASYGQIAKALQQVSDASLGSSEKIALLEQAAATEAQAIMQIERFADQLSQPAAALTA